MGMRIAKVAVVAGLVTAIVAMIWRLVIPRLPRSARRDDGPPSTLRGTLDDDENSQPADPAEKGGSSARDADSMPTTGEFTEQVVAESDEDGPTESDNASRGGVGMDWHATVESIRASYRRLISSWRIADRMPRALWIVLGVLFVVMGAFSAHASWREYDGLMTGFVILVVFSSVSAALSRDSVVAAVRQPISKDPALLLTDDALRLLTLTVMGVLFTALYPMLPAVQHLVAFFAGGALATAAVSVLVLLVRNVDIGAVIGPEGD